jgi:hypothetical protein
MELVCAVPPDMPRRLRGDPGRVRQVLTNLLGNAVKFTETGEVVLRVACQESTDGTTLLRFEVRDTGPGIALSAQTVIFDPFRQGDGSTTRKHGGTGLGLSISREIARLMGGDLTVVSTPGTGATFYFTARLKCDEAQGDAPLAGMLSLSRTSVLVVDDNQTNREVLHESLAAWGHSPRLRGERGRGTGNPTGSGNSAKALRPRHSGLSHAGDGRTPARRRHTGRVSAVRYQAHHAEFRRGG